MVKKIKFNLIIDNKQVRNLEDLRDNFNIDDVLRYYRNGLLKKWLGVRGYNDFFGKLDSISSQDNFETAKELVKIFEIEINANQVEDALYSIKYHQQWQRNINSNAKKNFQQQSLIDSHCKGYDALLQNMLNNKDNMRLIKIAMGQISKNYLDIFNYHMSSFFDEFLEQAPLVIFASLMNPLIRNKFFSSTLIQKKIEKILIFRKQDEVSNPFDSDIELLPEENLVELEEEVYSEISLTPQSDKNETTLSNLFDSLSSHLKTFKGDTQQYWNVIESQGQKFMIVGMREGNFVRSAGNDNEKLSAEDVNGKFPILDGIDYMSNNSYHEISYLEV